MSERRLFPVVLADNADLIVLDVLVFFHTYLASFSKSSFSCFRASLDAVSVWLNVFPSDAK